MSPISSRIDQVLAELDPEFGTMQRINWLRKHLPPDEARAAAELWELRQRARGKFRHTESLHLTRKGLEQASAWPVAAARAQRIRDRAPGSVVHDATAGVGGDSLALLAHGINLVAGDKEARNACYLHHNLHTASSTADGGASVLVVQQDAEYIAVQAPILVLDPDRRSEGDRRQGDPERWSPPLSSVIESLRSARGGCVKLAPAVEVAPIAAALPRDFPPHSFQWVSYRRELKEVALWTGVLASSREREVLTISSKGRCEAWSADPMACPAMDDEEAAGVAWISDPDPALVRSGLLEAAAQEQGLRPLHGKLGYLGGDHAPTLPLLTGYRVLGTTPLDRRRVRAMLAEHDVGPLVVKKRGHPVSSADLAKRFRGPGGRRGLLLVARLERSHRAYLVEGGQVEPPADRRG